MWARAIETTDKNIKFFDKVAQKYGADYALKKDPAEGKYLVFFKARDADALSAASAEYAAKTMKKDKDKPSLRAMLSHFKEVVKNNDRDTERHRQKGGIEL